MVLLAQVGVTRREQLKVVDAQAGLGEQAERDGLLRGGDGDENAHAVECGCKAVVAEKLDFLLSY